MKITPLPSVEKEVEKTMQKLGGIDRVDDPQMFNDFFDLLTQDRNQAYTSLVEGIKKEEVEEGEALYSDDPDKKMSQGYTDGYNQALIDILENVVKPLYGKK